MLIDSLGRFSNAQALTASAASTEYVDLKKASKLGGGKPLAIVISVGTAADTADGNETYAFKIQCDDNSSFSSATDIISRTIAGASLTAGSIHTLPVPPEVNVEQYIRLYATLGGTTPSVTITAWLAPLDSLQNANFYGASGYSV